MNNIARNILLAVATIIPSGNALAQIPDGYYDALKGKKGAELKTAVHKIIKDDNVLDCGSGKGSTWWGFYSTDNGGVLYQLSFGRRQLRDDRYHATANGC